MKSDNKENTSGIWLPDAGTDRGIVTEINTKSDAPATSEETPEETPEEQVVEITIPPDFRDHLKKQRFEDVLNDLDMAYQTELRKLAEQSLKFKQAIENSKTVTKDAYYVAKLNKNNDRIYDLLVQYETSRKLLIEYQKQHLSEEIPNADEPTV